LKYVLIIPDGMGDRPVKALGGKTPLEAARTPNMDHFASRGTVGLTNNIPKGFVPGTDIGSMSVFGYDPRRYYTGRGPLEAAVHGIELEPKDLAFRCNLVTLEGDRLKDFSADHISLPEAKTLIEAFAAAARRRLSGKMRFFAGKGTGYRHLAVLKNAPAPLSKVVCTPPHDIMGKPFAKYLPKGPSAALLNDLMGFSREFLRAHPVNKRRAANGQGPANSIWLWGQGFMPEFPTYFKRYGFRGGVITAVDLLKGIAMHAGLDVIRVPGVTGYFDTNYVGKAEYAVNSLRSRDFVAIHVESTDEAGHIGDAKLKIKAIEDVDRLVLGTLREKLEEFGDYKLLLLPDHFTCVETRTHSSDPVPFLAYSSAKEKKGPKKFSERSARSTGVVVKEGHRLMDRFVEGSLG
jgi:2,3-bisphosphoglycerate-independent phosphoglycerate mutase